MKENILMGLALLCVLSACNNTKSKTENTGYTLKGTIKGIPEGTIKIISNNEDDRTSKTIDSASFKNGTFELKGKAAPQIISVNIEPGNWSFQVFLEDTVLNITVAT